MSIIRTKKTGNYFALSNQLVNDKTLSYDAVGVAAYLLSKPSNWTISLENLKRRGDVGKNKIYRILQELEKAGYLQRERTRNSKGRLGKTNYVLSDEPHPENGDVDTTSSGSEVDEACPRPGFPRLDNPCVDNPPHTKDRESQITDSDKTLFPLEAVTPARGKKSVDDWFEDFWAIWLRRDAKKKALEKFRAACRDGTDPQTVLDGAKAFMALCEHDKTARIHIPLPTTWIHGERWNDDAIKPYLSAASFDPLTHDWLSDAALPESVMKDPLNLWRWRLGRWYGRKFWGPDWHGEPGEPGCRVPKAIMEEMDRRYAKLEAAE